MFLPINRYAFSFVCYILMPATLSYFLFFYVININGLYPEHLEQDYPWLIHKFKDPALEVFLIFVCFALVCKLNSYRPFFNVLNFNKWQQKLRAQYKDEASSVWQIC